MRIGTLIVFIAMVLVAAIAVGVLVNTAGLVQSQTEATGEESAQQVSDRVQVFSVVGSDKIFTNHVLNTNKATVEDRNAKEIHPVEVTVLRSSCADNSDRISAILEVFANGLSAIF